MVEALLAAGLIVLVIAPNQLKNLRSRYGSAGNKDDRYDAYVLADVAPLHEAVGVLTSLDADHLARPVDHRTARIPLPNKPSAISR